MTESQRIVLNWRAKLAEMGWPEDAIKQIVSGLCEAGYRECIEEIKVRQAPNERIIANAQQGAGVIH